MDDTNDTQTATTDTNSGTNTDTTTTDTTTTEQKTDYRPKLSDEEQLAILEGRAKRLKTKLGIQDDTSKQSSTPDDLVQKTFLRTAQITDADEVDLALSTAQKWNMTLDQLVDDADFQAKLEKFRTQKANEIATSGIKGSPGTKSASESPEFWMAKGTPPTPSDVPDDKTRRGIIRAMMSNKGEVKKFYNQ